MKEVTQKPDKQGEASRPALDGHNAVTASKLSTSVDDFEQPRFSRRETILTMIGVLMVMLLSSLDQTIVATAMPRVIADLNGFNLYTWVSTGYLLTSTVMVPIYGKLSDIFGRKYIFLVGLVIFLIGSGLSGASQTMVQLIIFRAFQGIGAGGLMSIAIAVVGDLFAPRERAKWQGVTGAVFGLSAIIGPTAGGWITDNSSWRWVFYVNLPIGIIALLVLIFLMPTLKTQNKRASIDYIGAALLIAATVPLLLGFSWAGSQYDWNSIQIISLFVGSVIAAVAFVVYEAWLERRGGQPIIEPSLFKNSIFSVSTIVTIIFGVGMFGSIFFIPLYVQGVVGTSITNSGIVLTPLMLMAVTGSIASGQIIARTGRYKWIAIIGTIISIGGTFLLLRLDVHSTNNDVLLAMLVLGLGMGFGMSVYTLVVQNALPRKIGQATAALVFFRQIGGTIGLAAMGSILNSAYVPAFHNALPATVKQILPAKALSMLDNPQILLQPGAQEQLMKRFAAGPQVVQSLLGAVKQGLATSIHDVFLLSMIITLISLVTLFFLKELPLRSSRQSRTSASEQPEEAVESSLATVV